MGSTTENAISEEVAVILMHPSVEYVLLAAISFGVTLLCVPSVVRLAYAIGAVAIPRQRDVHVTPHPRAGGLAMFAGILSATLVAKALPSLRLAFDQDRSVLFALLGAAVLVIVGLVDDSVQLKSLVKLCGQVFAASLPVVYGQFAPLAVPVPLIGTVSLSEIQSEFVGIALIIIVINAFNFIDGIDGLAASQAIIAASGMGILGYALAAHALLAVAVSPLIFSSSLIGAAGAFLIYNAPPAKIFMGDTGSMLCGFFLAISLLGLLTRTDPQNLTGTRSIVVAYIPVILSAAILALPLFDLVAAVTRRLAGRRSPLAPDKQHLHHWFLAKCNGSTLATLLLMDAFSVFVTAVALSLSLSDLQSPAT